MNKVLMIGYVGKEPELTTTSNGKKLCRFTLAVNRYFPNANGEKKCDFFNCVAWSGTGENIAKFCTKGSRIGITGSLETNSYTDKGGNKRTDINIFVTEVDFLQTKPSGNYENSDSEEPTQTSNGSGGKIQLQKAVENSDDYPF